MRVRTLVAVTVAVVAAALFVVGGTAATASPAPATASSHTLHLNSVAAAKTYLRSLGIDSRTVVIQHGTRNYAGPRCPGRHWNCTTATRVLQIGLFNSVYCTPSTGGSSSNSAGAQTCTIIQGGSSNFALCTETSSSASVTQDCNITQTGSRNIAGVAQTVNAWGGTQTATQTVEVTQTQPASGGINNTLGVLQFANQYVGDGGAQAQNAHQELTVNQTAHGSGTNINGAAQQQSQNANGGTTQSQNTNPSGITPCPAAGLFGFGHDPNECSFVAQTADSGNNLNGVSQRISESENSGVATTQMEGNSEGGIAAQSELNSATGASKNFHSQSKKQVANGPSSASQTLTDPLLCCGISANGNSSSSETLNQSGSQSASNSGATESLKAIGFVHSPNGSCSVTQTVNGQPSSDSASPCPAGTGFATNCTGGVCTTVPFSPIPELTVNRSGAGSGTVNISWDDTGVTCPPTCTVQLPAGTQVQLNGNPAGGSMFDHWVNCPNADGSFCGLTLNAPTTITADFEPIPMATLNVNNASGGFGGSGTVTSDVGGINCGTGNTGTCSTQLPVGTPVTLTETPTPSSGSFFSSWTGNQCDGSTATTCAFSMPAGTTNVTATFSALG